MSRAPLSYDRWLPSICLMWHQLPDDPPASEAMNLATLALGPGGLWGDLPAVGRSKSARISAFLGRYKRVAHDMAEAAPVRTGRVGGCPELHEKLSARGRGAVMVFASEPGTYHCLLAGKPRGKRWLSPGMTLRRLPGGGFQISAQFNPGDYAKTAFFGI